MAARLEVIEPFVPPALMQWLRRGYQFLRPKKPQPEAPTFGPAELDAIHKLFVETGAASGSAWEPLRDAHMPLPAWFRRGLDPLSPAYREQQERLWQLIVGVDRSYDPNLDEGDVYAPDVDAIRKPAFYMRRDAAAVHSASDHILAMGMILRHSGLRAGEYALEYGAGFGQTALSLARLGVHVDTVDVSRNFCRWVQEQADFFKVPLTSHHGHFGLNPRPGFRYRMIWFYESFHHCWHFDQVVPQLRDMLAEGGKVILGGEPIFETENAAVPYPWGVRLHSEVAAVMRQTRWMELGFSEPFLFELFARHGFTGRRIECPSSLFGQLYEFVAPRRAPPGPLAQRWLVDSGAILTKAGTLENATIVARGVAGILCYGPYASLEPGEWWVCVELADSVAPSGSVLVDVASRKGDSIHAAQWFELQPGSLVEVAFRLTEPVADLEVRVSSSSAVSVAVKALSLRRPQPT